MNPLIAIALGGACGAVLRFLVSSGVYQWLGRGFPYGTLVVNVLGSFLIGLLKLASGYKEEVISTKTSKQTLTQSSPKPSPKGERVDTKNIIKKKNIEKKEDLSHNDVSDVF